MQTHGQIQARLAVKGAFLEALGGPERVVEGLGRAVSGGDGVSGQFEEKRAEIGVVERGFVDEVLLGWGFLLG